MNPFKFGKQYEPGCFIDREDEYSQLVRAVSSGNNVILVAPRRFGKTWLLQKFALESGFQCIYLDLLSMLSLKDFAVKIISKSFELLKLNNPVEFVKEYLKNLVKYINFSISSDGVIFTFSRDVEEEILLSECYRLLERLGEIFKTLVVCLDEFQAYSLVSERLAGSLRSFFQTTPKVVFVFSGSMRHMIEELFFQSKGLMYHSGIKLDLCSFLPKSSVIDYVCEKFSLSGKKMPRQIAERFYDITKGHPYYVQMLAYEVWNLCGETVTEYELQSALNQLIFRERHSYDMVLDMLGQKHLRKVLVMIATNKDIFSLETLQEFEIPNPSIVNKTIRKLVELGFVEKLSRGTYQIIDPIFEEYVLKRFS
ncbi:ATP-binding protein [Pseudothermotoga sp.]|uniref:AAA family ATPase n=1 Tax=Pseudothermotoga sp. TaxID=2033661 RepID=UPI0031F67875